MGSSEQMSAVWWC